MVKYAELKAARDRAQSAWFEFLDKAWFGNREEKAATIGNANRYIELRDSYRNAQAELERRWPADASS
jgi:hypothetical protein